MNKILEIRRSEEILEVLDSKGIAESYPGFSAHVRISEGGASELRAEVGTVKLRLSLRPILHPSRRLVDEQRSGQELLVCPHLAEPLASDLRRAGIPHADLNGRLFLTGAAGLVDIRPGEIRYRSPKFPPPATEGWLKNSQQHLQIEFRCGTTDGGNQVRRLVGKGRGMNSARIPA